MSVLELRIKALVDDRLIGAFWDAAAHLKNSDTAFWLIAMFADGESACVAVNAKLLAPSGNA